MKYGAYTFLTILLLLCPAAQANDAHNNNFLLRFFDMNETAAVYGEYCLRKDEISFPRFRTNADTAAQYLLNELIRQNPDTEPRAIKESMKVRQRQIGVRTKDYYMHNGCADGGEIAAHYRQVAGTDSDSIAAYVADTLGPGTR